MPNNKRSLHPVSVKGYKGSLQKLSEDVHRMRYDIVQAFYEYSTKELTRQAKGDTKRGRLQLAALLKKAANTAEKQQKQFAQIYVLCAPYM